LLQKEKKMGRTKWKGPYVDKNLLKTLIKNNKKE
jgi:hypothetical protein